MRSSVRRAILLLAFVFVVAIPFALNAQATSTNQFSDVIEENPFGDTILEMRKRGFVAGYPDGKFLPDNSISRAEFVTMVVRAVNPNPQGSNCFPDVKTDWYAPFTCYAKEKGWVVGYADGTFKPANNINFAEAATILNRAYGLKPGSAGSDNWYKPFVETLEAKNAIPVSIDTPEKKISRAETTEINFRLATNVTTEPSKTYENLVDPLPKINSCPELKEKIALFQYRDAKLAEFYGYGMAEGGGGAEGEGISMAPSVSEEKSSDSTSSGDGDYSQTNVQVEGVDEADVIKNDANYIYMVTRGQVKIIKAVPANGMQEVVSDYNFSDEGFNPMELFVTKDKLVVVGSSYRVDSREGYYAGSRTTVVVIDITDRSNPKTLRTLGVDGDMISSRRIGSKVYLVASMPGYYIPLDVMQTSIGKVLPSYSDSSTGKILPILPCQEIRMIPNPDQLNFLSVVGFDIDNQASELSKAVVMGATGNTVYASEDNLYVAHTKFTYPEVGIFDTIAPQRDTRIAIWAASQPRTELHQFELDGGKVAYKEKGEVPGTILNQFSMDEYGDSFRLVTHTSPVWDMKGNITKKATNNLYVLNKNALGTTVGKIENIAPGEDIHSARFVGKRAYLVTFQQIDPFFVIDLSTPSNPKILGELKIPGYSDYLHPYDETHVIGFGKEVDPTIDADKVHQEDTVYFTAVQGLKIAMFDVTDPTNPVAMFKEVIGDHGTDSELLYNHKALLFDKAKGIFAFPVTVAEIKNKEDRPDPWSTYGEVVFQGAYVYNVDLTSGFTLKGKISNFDTGEKFGEDFWYWYDHNNTIKRLLYIGENYYGVSPARIKAVNRSTFQEIGKLDLNVPKDYYGPVYY